MPNYNIVTLPGDGIGPECLDAAMLVLEAVQKCCDGLTLSFTRHEAGSEHYRKYGVAIPEHVLADCLKADAVLLAAIGLPDVRKPDGTEVQPEMMMGLRRAMGLYAAVRPVKLFPGVRTPLNTADEGIDMVILRENLEGLFASFGGGCILNDSVASDILMITREGTERVVDFAFRLAEKRSGRPSDGKRKVTCVDKANVFRSFAFFRKVFFEVAERYPNIESDAAYVDAMSLYMVTTPSQWDVLVMENQFGDILSDLGAAIVDGLGMAPSAEIGNDHALFQPSHGTAPQLAGKNVANPIATILSSAMMLDWLADRHDDATARAAGNRIEQAVAKFLADGQLRTVDQGGTASTTEIAEAISKVFIAQNLSAATMLSKV
ncbi:MAG: isocitrate/isopropylmalate dehydrogenase family protein [Pirellulaceae bacterium]|nr:isocitrate/isopropylmalate dehydrogenase family protein [Pirellulaceae bacterium]